VHCAAKSRSHPKREAPRRLAAGLASKVCDEAGQDPDRADSFLFVFEAAGAVHPPL
jgi:hypothetical protein